MSGAANHTISMERGEAFDQLGLQSAARLRLDELQRPLLSLGFSVGAFGGESVEDVDHRDYPRAKGDLLGFQPIWIAVSVPALVMMQDAHLSRFADGRVLEDSVSEDRVLLHNLELFTRQLAGLEKYGVGDADLSGPVGASRICSLTIKSNPSDRLVGS